jgi:hypothetical protein
MMCLLKNLMEPEMSAQHHIQQTYVNAATPVFTIPVKVSKSAPARYPIYTL